MKLLILSKNDQGRIAEKIMELGNVAAGALIFGQVLSGNGYRMDIASLGFFALLITYSVSIIMIRKKL